MEEKKVKEEKQAEPIMHEIEPSGNGGMLSMKFIIILIVAAILGISTGFYLSNSGVGSAITGGKGGVGSGSVQQGKTYGSNDLKTFKDSAEGVLKDGGIEGEGQYHLERPGGVSQNVYMTSSLVDLAEFKGKKVKGWGETQAAQKAGWLMDVGRVQVL
jgi:hypothetical protein